MCNQSVKGFIITRSKLANQQIASLIKIASVFNNVKYFVVYNEYNTLNNITCLCTNNNILIVALK